MEPSQSENMPVEFDVKVMKIGTGLAVIIPKAVAAGFKIEKGSMLKMIVVDGEIKLRKT